MRDGPIRIYAAVPAFVTIRNMEDDPEREILVTVSNAEEYDRVRIELPKKDANSVTFCRSDLQKILTSFHEAEGGVR
jgi:hypothetical protein